MRLEYVAPFELIKASEGRAAYELFANEDCTIEPGQQVLIKTGLFTSFDKNYVAIIKEKSGNSFKHQLRVHAGVIDSDYRKEWGVLCSNGRHDQGLIQDIAAEYDIEPNKIIYIKKGDAVAQVIFIKLDEIEKLRLSSVDDLDKTDCKGGFGSTGYGIGRVIQMKGSDELKVNEKQ